jgi:hypothetical protein
MISYTALQEFRTLWLEEFGEQISEEQAMEIAPKLLNLFNHIYRPVKKTWVESLEPELKQQPNANENTKH